MTPVQAISPRQHGAHGPAVGSAAPGFLATLCRGQDELGDVQSPAPPWNYGTESGPRTRRASRCIAHAEVDERELGGPRAC